MEDFRVKINPVQVEKILDWSTMKVHVSLDKNLTHYQTTNFRLVHNESTCFSRQEFNPLPDNKFQTGPQ